MQIATHIECVCGCMQCATAQRIETEDTQGMTLKIECQNILNAAFFAPHTLNVYSPEHRDKKNDDDALKAMNGLQVSCVAIFSANRRFFFRLWLYRKEEEHYKQIYIACFVHRTLYVEIFTNCSSNDKLL